MLFHLLPTCNGFSLCNYATEHPRSLFASSRNDDEEVGGKMIPRVSCPRLICLLAGSLFISNIIHGVQKLRVGAYKGTNLLETQRRCEYFQAPRKRVLDIV